MIELSLDFLDDVTCDEAETLSDYPCGECEWRGTHYCQRCAELLHEASELTRAMYGYVGEES